MTSSKVSAADSSSTSKPKQLIVGRQSSSCAVTSRYCSIIAWHDSSSALVMFVSTQQPAPWCQSGAQPLVPPAQQQQQHPYNQQQQRQQVHQEPEIDGLQDSPREDTPISEEVRHAMYALILRSVQSASEACGRTHADVHRYAKKIEETAMHSSGGKLAEYERIAVELTGRAVALVRRVQQAQQLQQQTAELEAQLTGLNF